MVLNHTLQIESVEFRACGVFQFCHLFRAQHTGHHFESIVMVGHLIRHLEITLFKPALHHADLIIL